MEIAGVIMFYSHGYWEEIIKIEKRPKMERKLFSKLQKWWTCSFSLQYQYTLNVWSPGKYLALFSRDSNEKTKECDKKTTSSYKKTKESNKKTKESNNKTKDSNKKTRVQQENKRIQQEN